MSIELINLHSKMSAAILAATSSASLLSKMITLKAFTKYKNLVTGTLGLATDSYITTDNSQTIRFHDQIFASRSDA